MNEAEGILLVGGGGFIGRVLANRLAQQGNVVHVLSRGLESGFQSLSDNQRGYIQRHQGSQEQSPLVPELLCSSSTVIHLASTTTPGVTAEHPAREAEDNILPALRFIEYMQDRPPSRLIFISSGGTLYGDVDAQPANEPQALRPRSYYGAGKAALEHFFSAFATKSGVSYAVLRPSNVYGPGQPLRGGFGVVRHLFECVRTSKPLQIWGDGESARDFLYIDDLVNACVDLLRHSSEQGVFNVGTGISTTINQLRNFVEEITQRSMAVQHMPYRGVDVRSIALDCKRLHMATGWQPKVSLREGLCKTWDWLQDQ